MTPEQRAELASAVRQLATDQRSRVLLALLLAPALGRLASLAAAPMPDPWATPVEPEEPAPAPEEPRRTRLIIVHHTFRTSRRPGTTPATGRPRRRRGGRS